MISPPEVKELEKIIAENSNEEYIVSAETGKIENDGKMKSIIRTVVWHKPSQKYVVTMYREAFSGYAKWLATNMDEFKSNIKHQIFVESLKKPGL